MAWSALGLWVTDTAEEKLGFKPTEEEVKKAEALIPKVRAVDRDSGTGK